jgi:hypothetical protein
MASGSLTTTVSNTVLVAGIVVLENAADFISFANSFTERAETTSGTPDIVCGDRTVTSTGTYSTNVSQNLVPIVWNSAGVIIALRDAEQPTFSPNNSSMFLAM